MNENSRPASRELKANKGTQKGLRRPICRSKGIDSCVVMHTKTYTIICQLNSEIHPERGVTSDEVIESQYCLYTCIGTQISPKTHTLIDSAVQCNIANLPPLKLLSTSPTTSLEDNQEKEPHLQVPVFPEEEQFEVLDVDDEDYNPSLESGEDDDDNEKEFTLKSER